ncbi:pimeloyl-ACP methyl ester carboxylesterase [Herbihabitans rhizosphaerae]|uniref:Pimeloyl-ACP methyl ester carboxylesterase n=1 Tax=Herbihabitans rhizosphaerae TaxID=1872711 RepID=A0A4Q7KN34_9PSEU|nr:alpha/beta hydrolase [Herbihabitans rhizosphaerae]RZS37031.1 pimeloyl-ACP methyl ester carboxylesterase [Herbihabitans rhizosphaerae]
MGFSATAQISTPVLDIAYEQAGEAGGKPVILLHGFPYDVRAFDEVAPLLAAEGAFVLAPYLRGFGQTRFRDEDTPRSGQQAALATDLLEFMDVLDIENPVLAGYDWGGRAACIVAALQPERVRGLVTVDGYNIQDIEHSAEPGEPEWERTYWYQYYFHSERGRRALERDRDGLCEFLWRTWSPTWTGASEAFAASATSLHNPDFVDVVIHSYRHRYDLVEGDPRYQRMEYLLADQPQIDVPAIVLEGADDGIGGPSAAEDRGMFTEKYEFRSLDGVGHNAPQEAPREFADAVASLLG